MKWNSETESQTVKEKAGSEECRRETRNEINYPTTVHNNNKMQQRHQLVKVSYWQQHPQLL